MYLGICDQDRMLNILDFGTHKPTGQEKCIQTENDACGSLVTLRPHGCF